MVVMDLIGAETMVKIGIALAAIAFIIWGIARKINDTFKDNDDEKKS